MLKKFILSIFLISLFGIVNSQSWNVLPDTTRSCHTDSLLLIIEDVWETYLWSTNSTENYTWVKDNGTYWVKLNDNETFSDTTYVSIFDVDIVQSDTSIICGDTVLLAVNTPGLDYLWQPGDLTGQAVNVYPRDTTQFTVLITDPLEPTTWCVDTINIDTDAQIFVDSFEQTKMGCEGTPKGEMDIDVSGDFPPFSYEWPAGYPALYDSSIVEYIVDGDYEVIITDSLGCKHIEAFTVEPFPMPELEFIFDPDSVVYHNKPIITFSYDNLSYEEDPDIYYVSSVTWHLEDTITSNDSVTTHIYANAYSTEDREYDVILDYTTKPGCPGSDTTKVRVEIKWPNIPDFFSPNGDDKNQYFLIKNDGEEPVPYDENNENNNNNGGNSKFGIFEDNETDMILGEHYQSHHLIVFNRWGQIVYESENYQNDWDGGNQPDGTYYYVLKCVGIYGTDVFKGIVTILR